MGKTTFDKEFRKAFVVNNHFFERLSGIITSHGGACEAKIYLSNSSVIDNLTLDEVCAFPNMRHRCIMRIDVSSSYSDPLRIGLKLRNDRSIDPIEYQVIGNDKDATYVSAEIEKLLRTTFRWYSYIAAMPPTHQGFLYLILMTLISAFAFLAGSTSNFLWFIPAIVCAALAWGGYGFVATRLFPVGIFFIGDGIQRASKLEKTRAAVFYFLAVTVTLTLVLGVSVNILYDKYWK